MAILAELEAHMKAFWLYGGVCEWQLPYPVETEEDGGGRSLGTRRLVSVLHGAFFTAQWTLLRETWPGAIAPPAQLPVDAITLFMRREVHKEMLMDIFHAGGSFERSHGYAAAVSVRPESEHEFKEAWARLAGDYDDVETRQLEGRLPKVFGAHQARGRLHGVAELYVR